MKRFDKNQEQIITVYDLKGNIIAGTQWDELKINSVKQVRDYVGNRLCKTTFGRVVVSVDQYDGEHWEFGMNLNKYKMKI